MKLEVVRADPAGNITIFVLTRIADPALRLRAAKALLAEPSLKAEQVGFVIPPEGRPPLRPWRLEMMGGEFCGNAARSFGLYLAREAGLGGKQDVPVELSGAPAPLPVHVDLDASTAGVEIPGPLSSGTLDFGGRSFPVYFFHGITHVIAEGLEPDRDLVLGLAATGGPRQKGAWHLDAGGPGVSHCLGVMFYDPARRFMRPAVYVAATESLVFESSCGSGTAALAAHLAGDLPGCEGRWEIAQPGGVIEARVKKQAGKIETIGIGGPVRLGTAMSFLISCFDIDHDTYAPQIDTVAMG
jgi:diaminopimelate epimerase